MRRCVPLWVLLALLAGMLGVGCGDGTAGPMGSSADRALLEAVVHSTALGLGGLTDGRATLDLGTLRGYVHAATFLADHSGYFFAYNRTNNVCVAHWKNRSWEGTDKSDYQDSRGMYVIRELSAIANSAAGRGYLVYYWNNPVTGREERKLGYVEVIPGTDIYIGSGIYSG